MKTERRENNGMVKSTGKMKADKVQKLKRVEQAVKAILEGRSVQEVVVAFMEQFDVSETTAYSYTKEATVKIHQKIEGSLDEKVNLHYKRLETLYAACIADKDRRTARMVLKDLADLVGLDAPKRTDITTGGDKLATFVDVLGITGTENGKELKEDARDNLRTSSEEAEKEV